MNYDDACQINIIVKNHIKELYVKLFKLNINFIVYLSF